MRATSGKLAAFALAAGAALPAFARVPGPQPVVAPAVDHSAECSSDCLMQIANLYLAALLKHDPSTLEVSPTLRVSENSHPVALGDDIWNTVAAIRPDKLVFTDPFAGQVLVIGVLEMRAHQPFIYTIRLKVEHRRISESETMVTAQRNAGQHFKPEAAASFAPLLKQEVSADGTETRAQLLADARIGWGLDQGTIGTTPDCTHYENGESPDGASHCRIGGGGNGWGLRNVRVPLVDVQKGVVISYKLQDVPNPQNRTPPPTEVNSPTPVFYYTPTTFDVMQVVKIERHSAEVDALFMNLQEIGAPVVFPGN